MQPAPSTRERKPNMDELAELVVEKLRTDDGPARMSVLQGSRGRGFSLITPVTADGKMTFDFRAFTSIYDCNSAEDFARLEGLNFQTAEAIAAFVATRERGECPNASHVQLRFVPTFDPTEGLPHACVDINNADHKALADIFCTVVGMRPIKHAGSE